MTFFIYMQMLHLDDPVFSTHFKWLKQNLIFFTLTPIIKAISFWYTYYKQFQHMKLDRNFHVQYNTTRQILVHSKNFSPNFTLFGPQCLVTDRGTEYNNQEMTHLCSLFNVNHSPRTRNYL